MVIISFRTSLMFGTRFFPGPCGSGADIVVPMTDFSLPDIDEERITKDALLIILERTARTRQRLRQHGFAQGNKIASELRLLNEEVTLEDLPIELYGGPTLRDDFRFTYKLPQTPATRYNVPNTFQKLLEIYADKMIGGNISNVLRNQVQLSKADLGSATYHVFSPTDKYLDAWLQENLSGDAEKRFIRHEITGIDARVGLALPYEDGGKIQQFSFNTPQGSTIDPMSSHVHMLAGLDNVVVSEGIGALLKTNRIDIAQIFNPTSALHTESALEAHRRKDEKGCWQDVAIVNDDEMGHWIKTMINKQEGTEWNLIGDVKFPMPFLKDNLSKIDENAVRILRESHRRFLNIGPANETEHVSVVIGVGCGPKGGQNLFQCRGRYYVAAASTPDDEGAQRLLEMCGSHSLNITTRDVVGAGDAAFTATLIHRQYAPLEVIIDARHPRLSDERKRIAVMAFTTMLQRVFGELAYRSKARDLSGVAPPAFSQIFDRVLEKAIAAAHKLTIINLIPETVYRDTEWGISFMTMELER